MSRHTRRRLASAQTAGSGLTRNTRAMLAPPTPVSAAALTALAAGRAVAAGRPAVASSGPAPDKATATCRPVTGGAVPSGSLVLRERGSRLAPPPLAPAPVVAERQLSLGERPGNHGLLDPATEDEPTTAGAASVEAERELLQVGLQVGRGDRGAQPCPVSRVPHARCARQPTIGGARALRGRYPAPGNERVGSRAA